MSTLTRQSPKPGAGRFEAEAALVLGDLRSALAQMIDAIPGDIARPTDLQRALRVTPRLGWQVFRFAHEPDSLAAGALIPKAKAMRRILEAAGRVGVPRELLDGAEQAFSRFERFVDSAAGDRESFETIVSDAMPDGEAEQVDLPHRRAQYRANSHIFGVQVRTLLSCAITNAADNPIEADYVAISGVYNTRRFRRDSTRILTGVRYIESETAPPLECEPLVSGPMVAPGTPLLTEFSTRPFPPFRTRIANGRYVTELVDDEIGSASAVTYCFGRIVRGCSRYRSEDNTIEKSESHVSKPVQVLVHDLLVHEGLYGPLDPQGHVLHGVAGMANEAEDRRLPQKVAVKYLGKGPGVLTTPDVPRYAEMARWAFERMGWDGSRFDVYRCRIEYPVMPSRLVVQFPLPEPSDEGG